MINGYKIIDFKGLAVTVDASPITVDSSYYKAIAESNKPLVIANLDLTTADVAYKPFFVNSLTKIENGGNVYYDFLVAVHPDNGPLMGQISSDNKFCVYSNT